MSTIIFETEQAINATHWCISNFKNDDWDVHISGIGSNINYRFSFVNEKDHLLFVMKWT
jgi:hypothetical protein